MSPAMRTLFVLAFSIPLFCLGQNLVPNPSFEMNHDKKVLVWQQPHGNYYHYTEASDDNGTAVSGKFFNGICVVNRIASEYLEVKLMRPLVKGEKYKLGFYLRLDTASMHNFQKVNSMDVVFSPKPLNVDTRVKLKIPPHLMFVFDTTKIFSWTLMETEYTASGGEAYLLFGKFFQDADSIQKTLDSAKNDLAFARKRVMVDQKNVLDEYNKNRPKPKKKKGKNKGGTSYEMYYNNYKTELKQYDKEVKEVKSNFKQVLQHNIDSINKVYHVNDYYYDTRFFFDDVSLVCSNCDVLSGGSSVPVPGKDYQLNNIHFESTKYELLPDSYPELDKLVKFLSENIKTNILISGHTDNTGDEEENRILSRNRAQAVIAYLVQKGIDPKRLSSKGYGSSKPVSDNETAEGRQKNRRVEFTVVK
jgi:outer membrane protein OmpA-like peptidoglycan-associated protein